ncbi:MerR family transcriptional regulator [Aquimarina intermedia]|uniref:MerR family transcriptional regulator n=1 Tax=Aquimarina intermedia TaxID=350814 RepID=UPI0011E681C9|nr:MerR family transcriptional regulator [Aquimarina intermedia]
MNNIKQNFSIKDLENLCGVKAHTIRIWEKRYNLLTPERTETNIRTYSLTNLQKLLNVSYLVNSGYKISRISKLQKNEIDEYARRIVTENSTKSQAINAFKIAMLNFDVALFHTTFNELKEKRTFKSIFNEVFIPFLTEIGFLWQTGTITPSHEHFITHLIKQKLTLSIEQLQHSVATTKKRTFVLFLPQNEIHDLGILYVNYELLSHGYKTIYLGASIPLEDLKHLITIHPDVTFLSYFTVQPEKNAVQSYIEQFDTMINSEKQREFWMLGKQIQHITNRESKTHRYFESIEALVKQL